MIDSFAVPGSGDVPINVDDIDWPPDSCPVDVYSPSGDFIAAGIVAAPWIYAAGDYVYAIRPDESEEMVVVRYRLVIDED